jgi:hypothetical protein
MWEHALAQKLEDLLAVELVGMWEHELAGVMVELMGEVLVHE